MNDFLNYRKRTQFIFSIIFFLVLIGGWFYPLLGYFIPFCMILGIGSSFFVGRKWCDWTCPRGSFYDFCLRPLSPKREIPGILKNINFRLLVLVILMVFMLVNLVLRWPDPIKIGKFFVILLTITTVLGIILALLFHPRSWCLICPIGTLIHFTGNKNKRFKIDSDKCISCKLCDNNCPIQINPSQFKKSGLEVINNSDCLRCGVCISVCPKKAISR